MLVEAKRPKRLFVYIENKPRYNQKNPLASIALSDSLESRLTAKSKLKRKYIEKTFLNRNLTVTIIPYIYHLQIDGEGIHITLKFTRKEYFEIINRFTIKNGVCQESAFFCIIYGKLRLVHEEMPNLCKEINMQKPEIKKKGKQVGQGKWIPGYEYYSSTIKDIYLYNLYNWVEIRENKEKTIWGAPLIEIIHKRQPILYRAKIRNSDSVEIPNTLSELFEKRMGVYSTIWQDRREHIRSQGDKIIDIDCDIYKIQEEIDKEKERLLQEVLTKHKDSVYIDWEYYIIAFMTVCDKTFDCDLPAEFLAILPRNYKYKKLK